MQKKVAVIGAGIFGVSIALELSKNFDVTLYERASEILSGASKNNHLRHHQGYHYPRSKSTALECIRAQESFDKEYGECVIRPFDHYHAIAKEGSKITAEDYLKFCEDLNLPYEIIDIDKVDGKLINKNKITLLVKVPEYSYDIKKMFEIIKGKLANSTVKVKLGNEIVGGEIKGDKKILKILSKSVNHEDIFDFVINATYFNFNSFHKWFGLPQKKVLYELLEILEIELPIKEKLGLSIFDGPFSTMLPRAEPGRFTLAHIKEEVLKEIVSDDLDPAVLVAENTKTNRDNILRASLDDFPILKEAKFIRSIYETKVVKAGVDSTDERPSEITPHGNGLFSVFSGKIVTCVDIAKEISKMIEYESHI